MSIAATQFMDAFDRFSAELAPSEFVVLAWFLRRGGEIQASYQYVANGLKISRNTVRRAVASLIEKGLLVASRSHKFDLFSFQLRLPGAVDNPSKMGHVDQNEPRSPQLELPVETQSTGGSARPQPKMGHNTLNTLYTLKRGMKGVAEKASKGIQGAFAMALPDYKPPGFDEALELWIKRSGLPEGRGAKSNFAYFIKTPEDLERLKRSIEGYFDFRQEHPDDRKPIASLSNFIGSKQWPKEYWRYERANWPNLKACRLPARDVPEELGLVIEAVKTGHGKPFAGLEPELFHAARGNAPFYQLRYLSPEQLKQTILSNLHASKRNIIKTG